MKKENLSKRLLKLRTSKHIKLKLLQGLTSKKIDLNFIYKKPFIPDYAMKFLY